jgi:hypothetical protein
VLGSAMHVPLALAARGPARPAQLG